MTPTSGARAGERRDYRLLLSGGSLHMMGLQIGDFRSVLPWIAGTLGRCSSR